MKTLTTKLACFINLLSLLMLAPGCGPQQPETEMEQKGGYLSTVLGTTGEITFWTWNGAFRASPAEGGLPAPGYFGYFAHKESQMPVEMLLLGRDIAKGELQVEPLGILRYRERESGRERAMVLAVPLQSSLKTIKTGRFLEFMVECDPLKRTIELWVQHAPGYNAREILRWEDEAAAKKALASGF